MNFKIFFKRFYLRENRVGGWAEVEREADSPLNRDPDAMPGLILGPDP